MAKQDFTFTVEVTVQAEGDDAENRYEDAKDTLFKAFDATPYITGRNILNTEHGVVEVE